MRIPRIMAKHLAITLCLVGLMAGSLCAGSVDEETLNRLEQESVHANTRRLLLPRLSIIYHPAPPASASPKKNYVMEPAPPGPKEYYDALTASKELFDTEPAPPRTKEFHSTPAPRLNRGASKIVDCGDRLCAGIWIGRRVFVLKEL